jgi:hypothetical protein
MELDAFSACPLRGHDCRTKGSISANGIIGYFPVDRLTARVTEVNSNAVHGAEPDRYRRRMVRTHCPSWS